MKKYNSRLSLSLTLLLLIQGCNSVEHNKIEEQSSSHIKGSLEQNNNILWPKLAYEVKNDPQLERKVKALVNSMTLEQKVAQMIQPEIRDISVEDMRKYGFGSYLNGGGSFPNGNKHSTPSDWIKLAEDMYQASVDDSLDGINIPTMWGTDAVHGHNNVIGATLFPHNIGLGAANNPDLIENIAAITAKEVMVTGIDWVFAPTVAVVRDDRWGRTYEGYSEDPDIVKIYAASIVKGLQGHADKDFLGDTRVISTVKHFLGDGGTVGGDDQGDNIDSEEELFKLHAQGYIGGLAAGSQSVMASFNSWHGKKNHGSKYLLNDVLKEKMGFDGFVVGDWNGHGQVKGCSNESCAQAVNAGLDIFMVPTSAWKPLLENTIAQVKAGEILASRIDDAVSRILRVKLRAGLFDKPSPANRTLSGRTELIGAKEHRAVARDAVRQSLVLLKNKKNILPLSPKQHILVAGDGANNITKQSGGWTVTWQGTQNTNAEFPGGTSIYQGIAEQVKAAGGTTTLSIDGKYSQKPDVAVVVFGEDPYAEGHGDRANVEFQLGEKQDLALLKSFKSKGIPVVALFISGRPMWVNAEINASDAFVAVWLPGSEGQGVADVILKSADDNIQYDFTGKLSFSWPKLPNQTAINRHDAIYDPLLPYGFGLNYGEKNVLADDLNETFEWNTSETIVREIYTGAMHKPWLLWLLSGNKQIEVNANSHKLQGLKYRTIDRIVQEDAMQIELDGTQQSGIMIASKSSFREDFRPDLAQGSALKFMVKTTGRITQALTLSMECEGEDSCGASLDIKDTLNQLTPDTWETVSIDLTCFSKAGMKMGDLVVPFKLMPQSKVSLGLANIRIEPVNDDKLTIDCH
ncbi:exo 1,3/1,4-beta-D-glucan glucohydrolase [Colwellia sp. UCD-KL20]|uniref:glycoside hydrolase family 3 protein n=1 Tax=Colwellia sp. UCD-KL20 TaxID=1917165 RepID=UPI0009703A82|nr:exo 1,3/1,4-beta-D-glucan glucohydrolase [Colwellia sp. UCD-KL20]